MDSASTPSWWLYRGTGVPLAPAERDRRWPAPPPWRTYAGVPDESAARPPDTAGTRVLGAVGGSVAADPEEVLRVNTALFLRRPLLVAGEPGSGKSALAHRIARELGLGPVLRWRITGGSTLGEGLYVAAGPGVVRLGPLGTALLPRRLPRVILADDLDRSGFDLPDELLGVLEDGEFAVPELLGAGAADGSGVLVHTCEPGVTATVREAVVRCHEPPLLIATTGGERDLPASFLRRCVTLDLPRMTSERLAALARSRFPALAGEQGPLLDALLDRAARDPGSGPVAERLLNALHLVRAGALGGTWEGEEQGQAALDAVWRWAAVEGP
ncbi:MoxR family ATPase [Streptomyces sp. CC219B]|uniref:AAA family ATPase n=1 Tax=Streptomyces sp. CC219B TaxID=3044574 RepID=UPI0024A7F3BD|nr:MoxR family ATPase [Streptomyces sp. CC219B]